MNPRSLLGYLSLLLVFTTTLAQGAEADNARPASVAWKKDFRTAVLQARKERKPILIEVTASWCGYCHKMLRETFTDAQVVRDVDGCFVPLIVDADAQPKLVEAVGVRGLPATVIVSPDLKIVGKVSGYKTAKQMHVLLGKACPADRARTVSK